MENENNSETKQNIKNAKLYCEKCKFQAVRPAEWLRHIASKKHLRDGKKLEKFCDICNKEIANHFLYKLHMLAIHATPEERSKQKYYCDVCDVVFISKLFYDKHCSGKIHNNVVKALDALNNLKVIDV